MAKPNPFKGIIKPFQNRGEADLTHPIYLEVLQKIKNRTWNPEEGLEPVEWWTGRRNRDKGANESYEYTFGPGPAITLSTYRMLQQKKLKDTKPYIFGWKLTKLGAEWLRKNGGWFDEGEEALILDLPETDLSVHPKTKSTFRPKTLDVLLKPRDYSKASQLPSVITKKFIRMRIREVVKRIEPGKSTQMVWKFGGDGKELAEPLVMTIETPSPEHAQEYESTTFTFTEGDHYLAKFADQHQAYHYLYEVLEVKH